LPTYLNGSPQWGQHPVVIFAGSVSVFSSLFFMKCLFVEKFNSAKRLGDGGAFPLFDVQDIQEVLPDFFFCDFIR
jgi:hypothetical protein